MQWTLPQWRERQKILYTDNKLSEEKIKAIVESAIAHQFYHEALFYIPKISTQDYKKAFLKTILNVAVETGDLFLAKACRDAGADLTQQEKNLLKNQAEQLGKTEFAQDSWNAQDHED